MHGLFADGNSVSEERWCVDTSNTNLCEEYDMNDTESNRKQDVSSMNKPKKSSNQAADGSPELSPAVMVLIRKLVDCSFDVIEAHFANRPSNDHTYRVALALDRWLEGIAKGNSLELPDLDPPVATDEARFCPLCGKRDAVMNLQSHCWGVCWTHMTCWSVDGSAFDIDELYEEPRPTWFNWDKLSKCRVVVPYTCTSNKSVA